MLKIEQYGMLEYSIKGPASGNPFTEKHVQAVLAGMNETLKTAGFYDGNGIYKIRLMPSFEGSYTLTVTADFMQNAIKENLEVTPRGHGNHGPVRVSDKFHFCYEDGTTYIPVGTTCYAWLGQPEVRRQETLKCLASSPFNKIRFCVFPKHYRFNFGEPETYPYEGTPCDSSGITLMNMAEYKKDFSRNEWDFSRFNPLHFQLIDRYVEALCERGIQADIILFHPYDRWGFSQMGCEADLLYVSYMIARYAAYRNVWWSLANEFDLMKDKTSADWLAIADTICRLDPYHHLRSIHNCHSLYDHTFAWVTHCSIQRTENYASAANSLAWRKRFGKPIILDEVGYEGNIDMSWGNLTAEEMTRLFWIAAVRGAYCGHGETYWCPEGILWWSHGGRLKGQSPERIAFLLNIIQSRVPGQLLEPADMPLWNDNCATAQKMDLRGKYYLAYCGASQSLYKNFNFNNSTKWRVSVIDTWNMTIEDRGEFCGSFTVQLPPRPYMALELRLVGEKNDM